MLTKIEAERLKGIARSWQNHRSSNARGNSYLQLLTAIEEMTEEPDRVSEASCDLCGDNPGILHLHSKCHMTAPLQAVLEGDVLTLRCYDPSCNRIVTKMVVSQLV